MYSLLLDENGRVLSVMDERYASDKCPLIEDYPQKVKDGCSYDYLYVDGEWIYDPIPVDVEPTIEDILNAMLGVTV